MSMLVDGYEMEDDRRLLFPGLANYYYMLFERQGIRVDQRRARK